MTSTAPRIPLALVTGFLGSGKTTFLKRVIARYRDRKLVYLVNEFSPYDVDGPILAKEHDAVVSIPGGSIFCRCLVSQFIRQLHEIPGRFGAAGAPVQGVVIETSGIADPTASGTMLRETRLGEIYRLASIVTVVDPKSFLRLAKALPAIRAQVKASDCVILNKLDACPVEMADEAEQMVRDIRGSVKVLRARFCDVEIDLFGERSLDGLAGEYARCADPSYTRIRVVFQGPVDIDDLRHRLGGLSETLYRAKGFVPTTAGVVHLDISIGGQADVEGECSAAKAEEAATGLALIVRGGASDAVAVALAGLANAAVKIEGA